MVGSPTKSVSELKSLLLLLLLSRAVVNFEAPLLRNEYSNSVLIKVVVYLVVNVLLYSFLSLAFVVAILE